MNSLTAREVFESTVWKSWELEQEVKDELLAVFADHPIFKYIEEAWISFDFSKLPLWVSLQENMAILDEALKWLKAYKNWNTRPYKDNFKEKYEWDLNFVNL